MTINDVISAYAKDRDRRGIRDFRLTKQDIADIVAAGEKQPAKLVVEAIAARNPDFVPCLKRMESGRTVACVTDPADGCPLMPDAEIERLLSIAYPKEG